MILDIKKLGINGEGIAYDRKIPVFLSGCLPGETVDAVITEDHGNYKFAEVKRILKKSPSRIDPECRYFNICDGCPLMILSYKDQIKEKKNLVFESIRKYAGIELRDLTIIENSAPFGYRNSCKVPFGLEKGKLIVGMYRSRSNELVPIQNCVIQEKDLNIRIKSVLSVLNKYHLKPYNKKSKEGLRYLFLRVFNEQWQCCLIKGNEELPSNLISEMLELEGLQVFASSTNTDPKSREIFGNNMRYFTKQKELIFDWHGYSLRLSPRAFFQLNTEQSFKLYEKAVSMISEKKRHIMEAYCGIGVISLMASRKAEKITAFEINEDAVKNAKRIAAENFITNIRFVCSDSGAMLAKNNDCDLLIVDPPRSGMDENMIAAIERSRIPEIIYISCSHISFAKNLRSLNHYQLTEIAAVDMFSNTPLIEIVAKLKRV